MAYYAVFDGHGGPRASRHCANRLHQHLIQNLPKCKSKQMIGLLDSEDNNIRFASMINFYSQEVAVYELVLPSRYYNVILALCCASNDQ